MRKLFRLVLLCLAMFLPASWAWSLRSRPDCVGDAVTSSAATSPSSTSSSEIFSRRRALRAASVSLVTTAGMLGGILGPCPALAAIPTIDVNNALAREYTAFPGLYPTVATKIVNAAKDEAFTNKKQVYAILNEVEQERLRQYDKSILIAKPDKALQQFKTSQICKYECGSRTSNSYRDEQIKEVQAARFQ